MHQKPSETKRSPTFFYLCYFFVSVIVTTIFFSVYWMGNSSSTMAAPVVVNATARHTASIIFLHGLGDTGHGWSEAFNMIKQPYIRYVCPTANVIPVSLNGGMRMPSWFDIFGLDASSPEDAAGIKAAGELVQTYIAEEEKKGIPRSRIMIGGFSQGGAVALYSAFCLSQKKEPLAGIVGLSTWFPLHKHLPEKSSLSNTATAVFQAHGLADPMVNIKMGKMTEELIRSFHTRSDTYVFKTYQGMGHSSCHQEMTDLKEFIDKHLPPVEQK